VGTEKAGLTMSADAKLTAAAQRRYSRDLLSLPNYMVSYDGGAKTTRAGPLKPTISQGISSAAGSAHGEDGMGAQVTQKAQQLTPRQVRSLMEWLSNQATSGRLQRGSLSSTATMRRP
jgi:hypothetical protein